MFNKIRKYMCIYIYIKYVIDLEFSKYFFKIMFKRVQSQRSSLRNLEIDNTAINNSTINNRLISAQRLFFSSMISISSNL